MNEKIKQQIESDISKNTIMLYMKGSPDFPMCNFSAKVVSILQSHQIKFHSANVLEDNDLRQGIKDFSDWPTIPQLYVNGDFVGGCDILVELDERGELEEILKGV